MGSGPNCVIGLSESSWPRSSKSPKSEAKGGCIRPCQNASHTSLSVPSAAWTVKGSGSQQCWVRHELESQTLKWNGRGPTEHPVQPPLLMGPVTPLGCTGEGAPRWMGRGQPGACRSSGGDAASRTRLLKAVGQDKGESMWLAP